MKPQLFNLKFQLFGIDCEIRNVDPDEFSYIVLIKDMKRCVAEENEVVQLYPDEKFRVEARLPLSGEKCLIDSDEDVAFLFKQYGSKGLKDIRLYVDALPVECVEPLQPLPEPNPTKPNDTQTEIPPEEFCEDDFHWSDTSNDDDGEAGDNDGGNEGEERAETGDNGGEERAETEGHLSDYDKNSDDFMGGSSEDEDSVSRMSRHMKANEFQYGADGKIYFEVGQVFINIDHFRKIFKDYIIQRGFAVKRVYNDKRRIRAVCREKGCPFLLYAALMVDKQSFQIRKYEHTHTCLRVYNNPDASAS